jgi:hypothetical protein
MGKRDPSSRSREDFPTLLLPTNDEHGTNRSQYIKKRSLAQNSIFTMRKGKTDPHD